MNVGSDRVFTRFIPAGAGNTYQRYQPRFQFPVYPRWRGEHNLFSQVTSSPDGLSPLARGTRYLNQVLLILTRFIPAGAGNTKHERPANRLLAVYPRWRGEHIPHNSNSECHFGLSPLARGTLNNRAAPATNARFIPAGAGNTSDEHSKGKQVPVYPRWRGEHL